VDDFESAELAAVPLVDNETDRIAAWRERMRAERAERAASRKPADDRTAGPAAAKADDVPADWCCAA